MRPNPSVLIVNILSNFYTTVANGSCKPVVLNSPKVMSTTEIITPQSRSRGMSYSILTQFERKLFLNCVFNEEVGVQKK